MSNDSNKLELIESLVREGRFSEASAELRSSNFVQVPRHSVLAYANLARRIGDFRLSLMILNPFVHGAKAKTSPASIPERIEYAATLIRVGAYAEAEKILARISVDEFPEAALQAATAQIARWSYREAIPLLESFLARIPKGSYRWCVGSVNLAAALLHEGRYAEAERLLSTLRTLARREGYLLLLGNSLELVAQLELNLGRWDSALQVLDEAWALLKETRSTANALYIQKWRAIVATLRSGALCPELAKVREEARRLRNWETVRDCDFHAAQVSGDREQLLLIYFGTPHGTYRKRLPELLGGERAIPESYCWSGEQRPAERALDLALATDGLARFPAGQALHRTLIVLCEDFYRETPMVSLFARIFPEEVFDPFSSPGRIHQLVRRFRASLAEQEIPLQVEERSGAYRLRFTAPYAIRIPRAPLPRSPRELEFLSVRPGLGEVFTVNDVCARGDGSRSTAVRLLRWAVEAGLVERIGRGPSARYRLRSAETHLRAAA